MATTYTSNLKLRIDSDLTADAKYNLNKIDTLGSLYQTDTNQAARIRSVTSILLEPNSPDVGGSGSGGTVQIGSADQPLSNFQLYADNINLEGSLVLADQASGSTGSLTLAYDTELNGALDNTGRTLSFDLDGADRGLILGGDFSVLTNSLAITVPAASSVSMPASGTILTHTSSATVSNKTINAPDNTLTNISNSNISASAAIAGTKIDPDFDTQTVQASGGFSSNAGVAFVLPSADGSSGQVLSTDGAGNLSFVGVASSVLAENNIRIGDSGNSQQSVDTSSLGDILADTVTGLTIKAGVIVDADVSASAAIDITKLAATADRALEVGAGGAVQASAVTRTELNYLDGVTSALQTQLDGKQPLDNDLTAIAALATTGLIVRDGTGSAVTRSIAAGSSKVSVTNADGFLGNPTVDITRGEYKTNWTDADGSTLAVTHSLGTTDVMVQLFDTADGQTILVDTVERTDSNTVTLTGVNLPGSFDYRVLILEVQ